MSLGLLVEKRKHFDYIFSKRKTTIFTELCREFAQNREIPTLHGCVEGDAGQSEHSEIFSLVLQRHKRAGSYFKGKRLYQKGEQRVLLTGILQQVG